MPISSPRLFNVHQLSSHQIISHQGYSERRWSLIGQAETDHLIALSLSCKQSSIPWSRRGLVTFQLSTISFCSRIKTQLELRYFQHLDEILVLARHIYQNHFIRHYKTISDTETSERFQLLKCGMNIENNSTCTKFSKSCRWKAKYYYYLRTFQGKMFYFCNICNLLHLLTRHKITEI